MNSAPGLGRLRWPLFAFFEALALPWRSGDGLGALVATTAAALATGAVAWTLRRGMLLALTLLVAFALVYLVGLGDAVGEGIVRLGLYASPGSALESLGIFAACCAGVGLVAHRVQRAVAARFPAPAATSGGDDDSARELGLGLAAAVVIASAWATSRWTYWGGGDAPAAGDTDGLGLPHLYSGTLFVAVGLAAYRRLDGRAPRGAPTTLRRVATAALPVVIGLAIFVLQSRRLMMGAALLLGAASLAAGRPAALPRGRARVGLVALGAIAALMLFGSSRWRDVDPDAPEAGLGERVERLFSASDGGDVRETIEARLTYLWFDAMARDLDSDGYATLDVGDLAASELARAIPRPLLPGKDDVPIATCESPFVDLGFVEDLPCTPHTEAWMAGGVPALALLVVAWGLTLGLCEALARRGPGLARVAALFTFFPFTALEGGMFPMIQGLRQAFIATALAALGTLVARAALAPGRRARGAAAPFAGGRRPAGG